MGRVLGRLSLLLLLCSPCFGAGEQLTDNILQLNCGLNSLSSPFALKPCELTQANNVNFTLDGSVKRRSGNDVLGTQINANDVTALYDFINSAGAQDTVAVAGTVIAKMDALDGTWDTITGAISLTADILRDCIVYGDELLCTDDTSTDGTWQFNGTGNASDWDTNFVSGGSIEKAEFVEEFHNYIVLANIELNTAVDHPSRFYWSDLNAPDTFRTTQFIDLAPNDYCGGIGGVKRLGERLVFFKERCGVYNVLFTGNSTVPFIIERTLSDIGTDSGFTIQELSNGLIFYSRNKPGIYFFDGVSSTRLSDKILPTILSFDESVSSGFVGAVHPSLNQYWIAMRNAGSSENDRIIVFDYVNQAFSLHTGIEASFMNTLSKSGVLKIYTGDYSGYVLEQDTSNTDALDGTDGQTINSSIKTAWFPLQHPSLFKSLQHVMVYHGLTGNYTVNFAYSFDFQDGDEYTTTISMNQGGSTWNSFLWEDDNVDPVYEWASFGGGGVSRVDTTAGGAFVRFRISNNANVANWEMYGLTPIFRHEKIYRPATIT